MSASAGRVLLLFKGDYDANVTYSPMDVVIYGVSSYVCKVESTGNLPTNTTYWQIFAKGLSNMSPEEIGIGYAIASGSGSARTATLSGYNLTPNGIVSVTFAEAVPANATLNINSEGAKAIYYRGAAIVANVIKAGDTATFAYDGTRYQVLCIDGGAGHRILNEEGIELPQQDALQAKNGIKATNDSTNERTIFSAEADSIDASDWYALTDQEKDEYAAAHYKFNIEDYDEADEFVNVDLMTKLWENPSPTASFAAQNVTLSSGDYDVLLITPTGANGTPLIIDKGKNGYLFYPTYGSASTDAWNYLRQVTYVDDTHLSFGNVISDSSANQYCVPMTIYGIKKRTTVKVDAIAANVKASVDYSTDEHVIGTWYDGSDLYEKTIITGLLPNNSSMNINHGISNLNRLVEASGIAYIDEIYSSYGDAKTSFPNKNITVTVTGTTIAISTTDNYSIYNGYVTIRYTKTS